MARAVFRHPDTWLAREELSTREMAYLPTHDFEPGPYIDRWHKRLSRSLAPNGLTVQLKTRAIFGAPIEGWLQLADALKLYEMAYFASGDILELGSYKGLSAFIMAKALATARADGRIYTVDLSPERVADTTRTLRSAGLSKYAIAGVSDAESAVKSFAAQGHRFAFAFIDHTHAYQPVYDVCVELPSVMAPGGFCLFHDFNDPRNRNPQDQDYGVYQAVHDGLDSARFEFYGIYGCGALYRTR
jgi:predicted O-methyltransferase YrrM